MQKCQKQNLNLGLSETQIIDLIIWRLELTDFSRILFSFYKMYVLLAPLAFSLLTCLFGSITVLDFSAFLKMLTYLPPEDFKYLNYQAIIVPNH